jgi:hypothetical protein
MTASVAVDTTPQDHPDRAGRLNNLRNLLGRRFEMTGSMDDLNRPPAVARMAEASGAARVNETATVTSARDSIFSEDEKSIPRLKRMQGIFDDEYLDIITGKDVDIETKSSTRMKTDLEDTESVIKLQRLLEIKIRNAKEGLQEL